MQRAQTVGGFSCIKTMNPNHSYKKHDYYESHFADGETQAEKGYVIYSRSHIPASQDYYGDQMILICYINKMQCTKGLCILILN